MPENEQFLSGQRWLSETEPELGLGEIIATDHRSITVAFRASAEERCYARHSAPLNRILFSAGDIVHDRQQRPLQVQQMALRNGLAFYLVIADGETETQVLPETELSDLLILDQPADRLLSGQTDSHAWFRLKKNTLHQMARVGQSPILGLCSARTELIPHQLYIASEVAGRYCPRVMLADEVGLGKTIEAGLILQQQLANGLSQRALIIVPEPLLHQWLVEMWRRFNLHFSLYDQQRYAAITQEHTDNPFLDEQLVLTSLGLLVEHPEIFEQACAGEWDLCIVDEAHHLSPQINPAGDSDYQHLLRLANACGGMLLLTATPEQLGRERHFSLLHLLDPQRFNDFTSFQQEQSGYQALVREIELAAQDPLRRSELLDRHGTGRILFRNTRRALTGFPERRLHAWPLPAADFPDRPLTTQLKNHPKIQWLLNFLRTNPHEKVLLICAQEELAIALEQHLRIREGIRSSVFYRGMGLLERDRAAAYFATSNPDSARIMVCSEIGSEGRNFQFCRHLILFDLPRNPDLLEQRIGRLDRIGQQHTINIHVPYLQGGAEALLFRWYHEVLQAFTEIAPAAWEASMQYQHQLDHFMQQPQGQNADEIDHFLLTARTTAQAIQQRIEQGKDRLLEMNSFDASKAATVIEQIQAFEQDQTPAPLLAEIFDNFGISLEANQDGSVLIQPGEEMFLPAFPGLPDTGMEITFSRQQALQREDLQFLHWLHPLVRNAMDLVMDSHLGRAAVSVLNPGEAIQDDEALTLLISEMQRAEFVIEALYRPVISAPAQLQIQRYLPAHCYHLVVANTDKGPAVLPQLQQKPELLDTNIYQAQLQYLDRNDALKLIRRKQKGITRALKTTRQMARLALQNSVTMAAEKMLEQQTGEIRRLLALQQRNPNVRESEIEFLKSQTRQLHECMQQASVELAAVHVIFNRRSTE
ncbi:MAG: SNF2-related protein [Pseudomonadales bacterium]|nr:SNF2-related protein [Pseudomonadales bacterium]